MSLAPERLPADGVSRGVLVVRIRDGQGWPVTNGTQVSLTATLGAVEPGQAATHGGVVVAHYRAGSTPGLDRVVARLGDGTQGTTEVTLEAVVTGGASTTASLPPGASEVRTYYYAGAQRVAMRVVTTTATAGVVYYLHSDHLGSASLVTTSGGAVHSQQRYTPYGAPRWSSGTLPTDYTFTGQRAESFGLMDYNARYYSPVMGRFISPDTIVPNPANPQLFNRYSYAGNNPILYNDPDGHCGPLCVAAVTIAGAAVGTLIGVTAVNLIVDYADSHGWAYEPTYHRQFIEQTAARHKAVLPAIALGAGLGVQSEYQNWGFDFAQAVVTGFSASVGPAQMRPGEAGNPYDWYTLLNDHEAGIEALASKMALADMQFILASRDYGYEPSMTDHMIILAIAQNGLPQSQIQALFQSQYYHDGAIDWEGWFFEADIAALRAPIEPGLGARISLWEKLAWVEWSWRGQLRFFVDHLRRLMEQGWTLPEGVDWDYLQHLAAGP